MLPMKSRACSAVPTIALSKSLLAIVLFGGPRMPPGRALDDRVWDGWESLAGPGNCLTQPVLRRLKHSLPPGFYRRRFAGRICRRHQSGHGAGDARDLT